LKPANILLVGAGGTLSAVSEDPDTIDLATYRGPRNTLQFKISDFGLAKQTDDSTSLTNTGAIMGSTSYMAPEQADGRTKQATRAMDIYALGIILYDLLTGKPPFTGPLLEVLEKIKNQPPPPLPSNVPPALARICLRCLEKKPERRFTTAAELAEALANYRDQPNNAPSFAYKPEPVLTLPGHQDQVSQVHFAASGQQLWSASHDCSEILYWDFTDETDRLSLPSHMTGVATFAVSDDEKWMMTCTLAGTLRLFDLQAEELVRRFDELSYPTRSVTFAPNSTWALTGDREGFLRLWDVPTGVHLLRKRGHKGAISTVVFAPNGEYFASGGEDCRLCLWRARTGESIRPQGSSFSFPQKYPICKICFSSDSKLIAFCDASDVIHIWEVASGRTVQQIRGHQLKAGELTVSDTVGGIVFSPDGRFLLSTGHDRTLRIWSVETGEECHRFTHDSDHFCCLAISRDGHYAATGSLQGPVRLWRLPELDSFHQKS
jgi:WD40 repeat protein